jgi:GTP-binding protein
MHIKAPNGKHGKGKNMHGKNGKDSVIEVPPGTLVYTIRTRQTRTPDNTKRTPSARSLLKDLMQSGTSIVVAHGGNGGRGNTRFKTSKNQAPRTMEHGTPGQEADLLLELKLIADIGLVGYPNAGKSTLLASISNAKPKIANYPFTTLTPNLGVISLGIGTQVTMADIPGIIEGAHVGKGLGLDFLRHIERTNMLIFVLDVTQDALHDYEMLRNELQQYNPRILKKPFLIVLNKMDLVQIHDKPSLKLKDALPLSALKRDGVNKLITALQKEFTRDSTLFC